MRAYAVRNWFKLSSLYCQVQLVPLHRRRRRRPSRGDQRPIRAVAVGGGGVEGIKQHRPAQANRFDTTRPVGGQRRRNRVSGGVWLCLTA